MISLKVIFNAFIHNECDIEIKGDEKNLNLIVILSSIPESGFKGESHYAKIKDINEINSLINKLQHFVENPTPKKSIMILDGTIFRIKYASKAKNIEYKLHSVVNPSVEREFVKGLFTVCEQLIDSKVLKKYIDSVNLNY